LEKLNLPDYVFKIRTIGLNQEIFDSVRKRYIVLTPEEWVRQNFVRYLIEERKYPSSLIAIEKTITVNKLKKRCDIVVYNRDRKPAIMVECKSSSIKITQSTFDQAARYNISLNVKYLIITNGINHYSCIVEKEKSKYIFLENIPLYSEIME
jgi:hypothetical protein